MITGDHAATARAIGARLGLDGPVMSGTDLAGCPDDELPDVADRTAVFAASPPSKSSGSFARCSAGRTSSP
jgi:cation-transporting ATPase F